MKILTPITIADSNFVSSTVPETDHAAWSSGSTYALGDKVILVSTHRIYESVQAGNTNHNPATDDGTWWLDIAPTNRWAMFDRVVGTVTSVGIGPIVVAIEPDERINMLAMLNMVAESVRVQVVFDAVELYDQTFNMEDRRLTMGLWEYFFEPLDAQTSLVVDELPPVGEITITIDGTACGTLLVGREFFIGETLRAPQISITDYSRKEFDEFGNITIIERTYAKRYEVDVIVQSNRVDGIAKKLAEVRATPTLYIGDDRNIYESLLAYGIYRDFDITIAYPSYSDCRLTIESLT